MINMKLRALLLSLLLAFTAIQPALAKSTNYYAPVPDESGLVEHGHYRNRDGSIVHSPAHTKKGKAPSGASAKCGDGSYSFSKHHRGTCSHHGGVVAWLR
jgi:hypothetical protein